MRPQRTTQRVRAGLDAVGVAYVESPLLVRGPRLLPAHHLRVRRARRSTQPRTRSVVAVATTVWPRTWAVRRPTASASRSASTASCWHVMPRPSFGPAGGARSTRSWSTSSTAPRRATSPTSCAPRASSADRRFGGGSMKSQMKSADRSGARCGAHRRRGRAGVGRGHPASPARPATSSVECPAMRRWRPCRDLLDAPAALPTPASTPTPGR